jgi:cell division ATPase FtsA
MIIEARSMRFGLVLQIGRLAIQAAARRHGSQERSRCCRCGRSPAGAGATVRVAQPENLIGMTDKLHSPAYSTSVGLLHWAVLMTELGAAPLPRRQSREGGSLDWDNLKSFLRRLLP